jgi:hypothetical protein
VTGTGITPVGGSCQAQATVQPPAAVVKDANGAILGTYGGVEMNLGVLTFRSVGGTTVAIPQNNNFLCAYFQTANCTGQLLIDSYLGPTGFFSVGVLDGTTLYYRTGNTPTVMLSGSVDCGGGCQVGGYQVTAVPATAATIPCSRRRSTSRCRSGAARNALEARAAYCICVTRSLPALS